MELMRRAIISMVPGLILTVTLSLLLRLNSRRGVPLFLSTRSLLGVEFLSWRHLLLLLLYGLECESRDYVTQR